MKKILELLRLDKWYNKSELIEVAKGRFELNDTVKEIAEQKYRAKQWQSRKQ